MATDFDFDEIDKAVNGALGGDTPASEQATPDQPVPSQPAASTPAVATDKAPTASSNPASRRSSGRFMDMVHPSSDMKNGTAGASGAPTAQGVRRNPGGVNPVAAPAESASASGSEALEADAWNQPLESPFLPDAVVEKRPLGGSTPTQHDFDALELLEAPDDPKIEAHNMPDPIDFAEQMKNKASADVAVDEQSAEPEIESKVDPIDQSANKPALEPEVTKESQPVFNPQLSQTEPVENTPSSDGAPGYGDGSFQPADQTEQVEEPIGPTSIQQQYKEQPSSSPESGAIFDTEAYHKPLAPVVKKKSGILVILWILLLVAFGGGMGAAVYFFVLPML